MLALDFGDHVLVALQCREGHELARAVGEGAEILTPSSANRRAILSSTCRRYSRSSAVSSGHMSALGMPDGRVCRIDEIMLRVQPGQMLKGTRTARSRVRFGRHEIDLYLGYKQGDSGGGSARQVQVVGERRGCNPSRYGGGLGETSGLSLGR